MVKSLRLTAPSAIVDTLTTNERIEGVDTPSFFVYNKTRLRHPHGQERTSRNHSKIERSS